MEHRFKLDAQRQYVVVGTLALQLVQICYELFYVSRAAAPKGAMSVLSSHGPKPKRPDWGHLKLF